MSFTLPDVRQPNMGIERKTFETLTIYERSMEIMTRISLKNSSRAEVVRSISKIKWIKIVTYWQPRNERNNRGR